MGKKCDLSDFDRGMIVGARQGALSISETAELLGFPRTTLEFAENSVKNRRTSSEVQFCGQTWLVLRGQRRKARLVKADREVTVMQVTSHYNSGMQKSITEHVTTRLDWLESG